MKTILSTKILEEDFAHYFLDANSSLICENFIAIQNISVEKLEQALQQAKECENLIFTSKNAAKSILRYPNLAELKNKKVFSVGIHTKELLQKNGFDVIVYTDYASELAEIISLIYKEESFAFFCGNLRQDVLPNSLQTNQIAFNEIQVYETNLVPKKIKTKLDAILFFSPSAVESYCLENKINKEICFCIGKTTAKALENKTKNIKIATQPTVEDVMKEVLEYYKL